VAAVDILNRALNETQNTFPVPTFCKRSRLRKSNCRRCVEICPENVITLDLGPTINNGCSDCGLCKNVCPTEVFHNEFDTDEHLLNQAKSFIEKEKLACEKKRLNIHCQQAENQNGHSLYIPCLGNVTENILLGIALLGFDEVILIKGICSQCRLAQGEKLLANSITISRILLESLGLGKFPINLMEQEKGKEKILSRREIFSKISNGVRDKAASFLYHKGKTFQNNLSHSLESKNGTRCSPKRRLLQRLIKQKGWGNSVVLKYQPQFPWGKIKINEKNCSACGICQATCPTGAISKKFEKDYQLLYFNGSLCTNCSLCKEACPKNAIDFEEDFPLIEILEDEAKAVGKVKLASCRICGEMVAGESEWCPTCRKREWWPIHINV